MSLGPMSAFVMLIGCVGFYLIGVERGSRIGKERLAKMLIRVTNLTQITIELLKAVDHDTDCAMRKLEGPGVRCDCSFKHIYDDICGLADESN